MKWVLFIVGGAGLLAGAGCANQQPYAYTYPQGYAPPAAGTTYAAPYYAQPTTGVPVAQPMAQPMAQPVMYQAQQQACVPCVPCQ